MNYLELRYAPRKCKAFCCGDCMISKNNKSCGRDINTCISGFLYTFILRPLEGLRRKVNNVRNKR